jgi:hypothetical protein
LGETNPAWAEDEIDLMLQHGQVSADMTHRHGYSDFTDPLGRFGSLGGWGVCQSRGDSARRLLGLAGDAAEFTSDRQALGLEY